ncbi:MAG: hydrogenase maturation nickel metallochaperone HypA [Phycisphaerae bacterium]|nr:hydrogenase maturation nickel metallochaperone HypA [Phycisphaerae bacterium]
MHEMSIAADMMDQLLRIADEQHAVRIVEVEVICGEMQQVVPEALQLAFEAVTVDTPAAGATLKLSEERMVANCRSCGQRFEPAIDDFLCPHCSAADAELIAGQDIVLKSVVCEIEDEAAKT